MANDMVYHYTSLDVLALILNTGKIRFKNLCNVDDELEKYVKATILKHNTTGTGRINIGKYCFVSCWTEQEDELITMWEMYGDRKSGVRIGLPKDYFQSIKTLNPPPKNKGLLPTDKNDCLPESFAVRYDRTTDPSITSGDLKINVDNIGMYKTKGWEFQKEYRYRIFAYKDSTNKNQYFTAKKFNTGATDFLQNEISEENIDLLLKDDFISKIEIVRGPCMKEKGILLDMLAEHFNLNKEQIIDSNFTVDKKL